MFPSLRKVRRDFFMVDRYRYRDQAGLLTLYQVGAPQGRIFPNPEV